MAGGAGGGGGMGLFHRVNFGAAEGGEGHHTWKSQNSNCPTHTLMSPTLPNPLNVARGKFYCRQQGTLKRDKGHCGEVVNYRAYQIPPIAVETCPKGALGGQQAPIGGPS